MTKTGQRSKHERGRSKQTAAQLSWLFYLLFTVGECFCEQVSNAATPTQTRRRLSPLMQKEKAPLQRAAPDFLHLGVDVNVSVLLSDGCFRLSTRSRHSRRRLPRFEKFLSLSM